MIEITNLGEVLNHLDGLKAVIFDLDDTLYSEKEYVRSGYRAIAESFKEMADLENKLWTAFLEKKPAIDDVIKKEGLKKDLKDTWLTIYRNHHPDIHFYKEVKPLFKTLRKKGLKLGVITDGRVEGQKAKITVLDLDALVDEIIITDALGGVEFRKPSDASFKLMKEKLGFDFDEIAYVGDNKKKDFVAPEKLGMKAIYFKNTDSLYV